MTFCFRKSKPYCQYFYKIDNKNNHSNGSNEKLIKKEIIMIRIKITCIHMKK